MLIPVYFMPGMAASQLIFEYIKLDNTVFDVHYLHWIIPKPNEPINNYTQRLMQQIKHDKPVLIGVSFGGFIVQEISKKIPVAKTIIISSIKNKSEFPRRMRYSKLTNLHKLVPVSMFENVELLMKYNLGIGAKKLKLYKKYLSVNDRRYLSWAIDAIINWDQPESLDNIIHIHGDKDPVFPIKYINKPIIVPGGTHVMIINRHRWFNEYLPQIILD